MLGTGEIILIRHIACGLLAFTGAALKRFIQDETRIKPAWSAEASLDLAEDVRRSIAD